MPAQNPAFNREFRAPSADDVEDDIELDEEPFQSVDADTEAIPSTDFIRNAEPSLRMVQMGSLFEWPEKTQFEAPTQQNHMGSDISRDSFGVGAVHHNLQHKTYSPLQLSPVSVFHQVCRTSDKFSSHLADMHLGRTFRVGWGPGGLLTTPSFTSFRGFSSADSSDRRFGIRVHQISASSSATTAEVRKFYEPSLTLSFNLMKPKNLSGLSLAPETSFAHFFVGDLSKPDDRTSLLQLTEGFVQAAEHEKGMTGRNGSILHVHPLNAQHAINVWRLIGTLWGDDEAEEASDGSMHVPEYQAKRLRQRFDRWLRTTIELSVEACLRNVRANPKSMETDGEDHDSELLHEIFFRLVAGQFSTAIQLALRNKDRNLALLIASLSTVSKPPFYVSDSLAKQLRAWAKADCLSSINPIRQRIYQLLSGDLSVLLSDDCVELEWLHHFGCFLWFRERTPSTLLSAAVLSEFGAYTALRPEVQPCPPFVKALTDSVLSSKTISNERKEHCRKLVDEGRNQTDVLYHLMRLFCTPQYGQRDDNLRKLLAPATHTANAVDYRLSFQLYTILNDLGYCAPTSAQQHVIRNLIMNFAAQLEMEGLWHWAIFVLLHLPSTIRGKASRENVIREILSRHVGIATESFTNGPFGKAQNALQAEALEFVKQKLFLPKEWIDECEQRAGSYGCRAQHPAKRRAISSPSPVGGKSLPTFRDLLQSFDVPQI